MRTPATLAAVALAAALGLTACTSSGTATEATTLTATSPSSSVASSPTADTSKTALEAAVRAYSKAYFAGNATAAYNLLSQRCASTISKAAFTTSITAGARAYGKQAIRVLTVDQLSGDLARVTYTYSVPALDQAAQPWTREGGAWHYDAC